ncbi:MAG: NAD-dependent epimerase/dehydratase family protein [Chloroflexi bacterium]|nr:NAD-dependent epimerase/dehydratase family protein [Chloroflexota bacterium]
MPVGAPRRVAVTGAAGYVGSRLLAALVEDPRTEQVLALDLRAPAVTSPKLTVALRDVAEPLEDLFRSFAPQAVVHLAFVLRPGRDRAAAQRINVGGTQRVLEACVASGVQQLLYLGSSTVYGAHPDNTAPLTEDAPPRPVKGFQYAEDKVATEALLADFAAQHQEVCVTVLRGCVVMGPRSTNFIAEALSRPVLVGVLGHDPPMQFLHEEDLVRSLRTLLERPRPGVFNIAGEGTVPYSALARLSGQRLVWLPAPILYPIVEITWRLRLQNDSPACGLDMIRWPWVVSTERLRRETGFLPCYTSQEALLAFVRARPPKARRAGRGRSC